MYLIRVVITIYCVMLLRGVQLCGVGTHVVIHHITDTCIQITTDNGSTLLLLYILYSLVIGKKKKNALVPIMLSTFLHNMQCIIILGGLEYSQFTLAVNRIIFPYIAV